MHILHVVNDLDRDSGGPSRSVTQLVESLLASGVKISLCYQNQGRELVSIPAAANSIEINIRSWRERFRLADVFRRHIENLAQDLAIDLIHVHGIWTAMPHLAARFGRRHEVPYLYSIRGMLEPWSLRQKRWKKNLAWFAFQRKDLQRAAAIHATGEMELKNLAQLGLGPPNFEIPNGLAVTPQVDLDQRAKKPKIALLLSRIHPKKGIEILIEAWQRLNPQDWVCHIVGPGDQAYVASLQSRIETVGLAEKIAVEPAPARRRQMARLSASKPLRTADL